MRILDPTILEGKTIVKAIITGIEEYDDMPYLNLKMSDDSLFIIISNFADWTEKSEGEYQRFIIIEEATL